MIPAQRYVSEEDQVFQNIQKAVAAHSTDQVLVEWEAPNMAAKPRPEVS